MPEVGVLGWLSDYSMTSNAGFYHPQVLYESMSSQKAWLMTFLFDCTKRS